MNIADILKGMNKSQLEDAVKKAKEFAATDKGKEMISKLQSSGTLEGGIDKDKIMKEIKQNPDIAKKISDIINGKD